MTAAVEPIVILGAGLAGLNCARLLHAQNRSVLLLEADKSVGGRVQSDRVDGFTLDRGFQVFQSAYPEARSAFDYGRLELVPLQAGAQIWHAGRWAVMVDPWRHPSCAWATLFNSVGVWQDRWKLFQLRRFVRSRSLEQLHSLAPGLSTRQWLADYWKFSEGFMKNFLRPWWSGIFLENQLESPASYFAFVFKMLSEADICLPEAGMQSLPDQLASGLPLEALRLNARVQNVDDHRILLASGEVLTADKIVIATDISTAVRLTGNEIDDRPWSSTTCVYFAATRPPSDSKLLMLLPNGMGPVNHLFIPSNCCSSYAPAGQSLISASVVGACSVDLAAVREQLTAVFGTQVAQWRHLRSYSIAKALPRHPSASQVAAQSGKLSAGIYMCGDYLESPSIHGALLSGRLAAESILQENR